MFYKIFNSDNLQFLRLLLIDLWNYPWFTRFLFWLAVFLFFNSKVAKRHRQWRLAVWMDTMDIYIFFKGAWYENFEKLIFLKLADKVSFHLSISFTMKNLQTCIFFRSNKKKLCLCYLLFYFSVVTTFSTFHFSTSS